MNLREIVRGVLLVGTVAGAGGACTTNNYYGGGEASRPASAAGQPTLPDATQSSIPSMAPGESAVTCQPGEQLGPWPPEANGSFHNIEVDGTQPGSFVIAEMWGPWGAPHTEYWVPMIDAKGKPVRADFQNSAGTGWQWNSCDTASIAQQIAAAKARRESEGTNVILLTSFTEFQQDFPRVPVILPGVGTTGFIDNSPMGILESQMSEARVRKASKGKGVDVVTLQ